MTDPIARRSIKYVRMEGSAPLQNIVALHTPRYAFFDGSITGDIIDRHTQYRFDTVFVDTYEEAYSVLINGLADAFFDDSSMETIFDMYDDVVSGDFIPVIGIPVSLSTQNPLLKPIISVVQKAMQNGSVNYLAELYERGRQEHRRNRLYIRLNEEEREFIRSSPVIPYAAEYYNYPISFFNRHDREWQGIYFDIIDELTELTGMQFEMVNDQHTLWSDLLLMLEAGDAYFISELLPSEARVGRFLWSSTPIMIDNYTLLSKADTPNVNINEVLNVRVGVPMGTAYAEMFYAWFPLHPNSVDYESESESFLGLDRGEVDMVISSQGRLLSLTNYHELSGYKANLIFVHTAESFIGFNFEQTILCSIIDKALNLIDVRGISAQWASRTFDYQAKILQAQRPWLIGAVVLSLVVLSLVSVLFVRSRSAGKQLDMLVKKRTAELEIATEEANAANKSKSSFLANMSHEIRTPMNTIMGVTEIIMQNESLAEEIGEGLGKIYNSCDMLMGIINDILDFSKIEAGKLDIIPAEYYVASLINDSIHLNMMRIGDKPIEFEVMVDDNIPAKLIGDELRIKQILNNLLSNAFKYTEAGKVILSVYSHTVKDTSENDEVMLNISVRDTGHGMTLEQVEKLFDEYSRFNEESNRTIEGTGLGLSITQRLINLMHGKIHVESKPGVGSIFSVSLRQGMVDSEILGRELAAGLQQFQVNDLRFTKRGQIDRDPMPYGKVLVVDDVEANLYVAEGLLKPYMLNIETVISGHAAIDKIKDGNVYDIVFMDHMMPEIDGMETTKQLRELGYTAPVVALTANAVAGQADIFMQNGFDNFISKPIDIRQLDTVLNKLVRDKQPPEVIETARNEKSRKDIRSGGQRQINPSLQEALDRIAGHILNGEFGEAEEVIASYAAGFTPGRDLAALIKNTAIAGLDISSGLKKFDGDTETYLKVLRSYASSIRSMFDLLENVSEKTLANGTLAEYQRAVHSIKGTSLDIFAVPVGEKARELEETARVKDLGFIEKENPAFIENVRKLISDIEDMLSAADSQNIKPKKDRIDRELLQKLHDFCETYDMDGVDAVMAEIERFQYETDGGLSAWLRENVDGVEFESIAEKLAGGISHG